MQAVPLSLATTGGISVDFCSCSYLDVSVRCVRLLWPMYSARDTLAGGFPHSDIHGSMLVCELPVAFRTLQRPSSPVIAKASTTCTSSLDPITLSPDSRQALQPSNARLFQLRRWFANGAEECNHNPCSTPSLESEHFTSANLLKIQTASVIKDHASTIFQCLMPDLCRSALWWR